MDLVLTLGVIKRLRTHSELLADRGGSHSDAAAEMMAPKGSTVGGFSAVTLDGDAVALDLLEGPTLVGFFSPTCEPCKEQAPEFVKFAEAMPGGKARVIAVVVGDADLATEFARPMVDAAKVVVESGNGPLAKAFQVDAFPAVGLVDEHGVVLDSSYRVERLTALAAF
ncbi:TlpA family protein disulfide reductase [Catellatospora methionotrophica]|uniref:TlpA family protein disulfide reductase n=1 Tax=Catellatospora methionotrophica TaxID=121620 RepID=UPI00140A9640|nr:TlpA disulfide reductase family protein [Catellatospora methionotrophica]